MASYNTSDFRKGLKVQLDNDPYLMIECNFVKPGKGQALYKCKLRNLIRNTVIDRTYKSGDSIEAADIQEIDAQLQAVQQRSATIDTMIQGFCTVMANMTEQDFAGYVEGTILNGEFATLQSIPEIAAALEQSQ